MFVVPALAGIEAATKPQVPVKTGTTNGSIALIETPVTKKHSLFGIGVYRLPIFADVVLRRLGSVHLIDAKPGRFDFVEPFSWVVERAADVSAKGQKVDLQIGLVAIFCRQFEHLPAAGVGSKQFDFQQQRLL